MASIRGHHYSDAQAMRGQLYQSQNTVHLVCNSASESDGNGPSSRLCCVDRLVSSKELLGPSRRELGLHHLAASVNGACLASTMAATSLDPQFGAPARFAVAHAAALCRAQDF